jgi:subtilase family serine protease
MSKRLWKTLVQVFAPPREATGNKTRAAFRPLLEELENIVLPSATQQMLPTFVMSTTHVTTQNPVQPSDGPNPFTSSLTPAQVRNAYGINGITFQNGTVAGNGSGQTIAIVDANDDPTIATDLAYFDQYYGLTVMNAGGTSPTFTKIGISATGQASASSFPPADQGWAGEITLDVEWAHAVAPQANILLVEANSASLGDLLAAVNYANSVPGVSAVSMSWGSSEFQGQNNYDSYFSTTGITYFGSSGDSGTPAIWPALSSRVVGVGGTSLHVDASGNRTQPEAGWSGSGGGLSRLVSQPTYQSGLVISNGSQTISANGMRAGPDVSMVADPSTGLAVYGTYAFNSSGSGGWMEIGGTSAAAPQWAGLMAIVNQGRALAGLAPMSGYSQTLPALYQLPGSDFHDITTGSNGYSAGPGFDLVTGRGTPVANLLVPALAGVSGGGTGRPPTVTTAASAVFNTNTSVRLSVAAADSEGDNDLTYNWTATGPGGVSFSANGASTTIATVTAAGTYNFQVTITDAATHLTASSTVSFVVSPVPTFAVVSPASSSVNINATQQFTATIEDQFGHALASQPTITWAVTSGTGTGSISPSGLYTAPGTTGSATITATGDGISGTASVAIMLVTGPSITTPAYIISQSPTSVSLGVAATDPAGANRLTYTWSLRGTPPGSVSVSSNGTNAAQTTTAYFTAAGTYNFVVTVKDPSNLTATSMVTVTVAPVLTSITVSPSSVTLADGSTQQFTATAKDQFNQALANQPSLTWRVTSGPGSFSATTAGLYLAPASGSGTATIQATSGNVVGRATVTILSSSPSVLFSDNFASGAGQWTVDSGSYYLATLGTGEKRLLVQNSGEVSRIVAGSSSWTNYSVQGTVTVLNSYSGSVSLLARVQDDNHLYFFGYNSALGAWTIARKDGPGVTTLLAAGAPFAIQDGQDYVVRADLSGNSLALYVNGVLQVSTTDSTYASGKIGFSATWASGLLGNVTVTAATGPATAQVPRLALADSLQPASSPGSWQPHQAVLDYADGFWEQFLRRFGRSAQMQ